MGRISGIPACLGAVWLLPATIPQTAGAGELTGSSPTLGLNFEGARYFEDSIYIPPDTMGAIGPNHFMEVINGNVTSLVGDDLTVVQVVQTQFALRFEQLIELPQRRHWIVWKVKRRSAAASPSPISRG